MEREREVQSLRSQVAQIPRMINDEVNTQVVSTIAHLLPAMMEGLAAWDKGGRKGPLPVPSFDVSNSRNASSSTRGNTDVWPNALVTPPPNTAAPGVLATMPAKTALGVTSTPVVDAGPSTLAELDDVAKKATLTNR